METGCGLCLKRLIYKYLKKTKLKNANLFLKTNIFKVMADLGLQQKAMD